MIQVLTSVIKVAVFAKTSVSQSDILKINKKKWKLNFPKIIYTRKIPHKYRDIVNEDEKLDAGN